MTNKLTLEQYALISRTGREYTPAVLPKNIKRFPVGQCFDACIWNAMKNPLYGYVEGIARVKGDPWALHAWLTDGVYAFDPTWKADINGAEMAIPAEYIGIEMDAKAVMEFMKDTKYQGVLANRWRNEKLALVAIGLGSKDINN